MNERKQFDLLIDIARLLKKYGPDAFENLAKDLKKAETVEKLGALLQVSADASRKAGLLKGKKGASTRKKMSAENFLRELESTQPAKALILATFYDDLTAKNALPSLGDITALAIDKGLEPMRAKSRDKAIPLLLKDLANRPIENIRLIVEEVTVRAEKGDRSLQGWAGVILNDKQRNKS